MKEKHQAQAIDMIAATSERLKREIWLKPGKELRTELSGLSGGERLRYDICRSIWDGEAMVSLYEVLNAMSNKDCMILIKALAVAKLGTELVPAEVAEAGATDDE